MARVLFLCTGNYYRSRYAEIVFNHHATSRGLVWRADSAGLMVDVFGIFNPGPIASQTRARLGQLQINCPTMERRPRQVEATDFEAFPLVVAVKEAEHREMMRTRFPAWEERITYWNIDDLGDGPVEEALTGIDREIRDLLTRLEVTPPVSRG